MISAGDFRNGKTFEMDGQVFQVVEKVCVLKQHQVYLMYHCID